MIEFISNDSVVYNMINTNQPTEKTRTESITEIIKPKFTIRKEDDLVKIRFSNFTGDRVKIFSKRSSEKNFELLGETTEAVFTDLRPNLFRVPELREYMAHYSKNNESIGEPSEVVLIIKK